MTHQIEEVENWPKGDSNTLTFTFKKDGEPQSLQDREIEYQLRRKGQIVLDMDEEDGIESEVVDEENGVFRIHFESGTTEDIPYSYVDERVRITNEQETEQTTWFGSVSFVEPDV